MRAIGKAGATAQATDAADAPPSIETVLIRTEGDRFRGSLQLLGGTGVFVAALREAILDGRCDIAVHSLKDLPTTPAPGLTVAAIPRRVDPRDALCARDGLTLATLRNGARVGTGSPRRKAQLLAVRPDLDVIDIRGNVDTRLGRVAPGDLDAVVLAAAGLERLGRTAERGLLAELEAGCAAPVGTLGTVTAHDDGSGHLTLDAVVASLDGSATMRRSDACALTGSRLVDVAAAEELGRALARTFLADGAAELAPIGPGRP